MWILNYHSTVFHAKAFLYFSVIKKSKVQKVISHEVLYNCNSKTHAVVTVVLKLHPATCLC